MAARKALLHNQQKLKAVKGRLAVAPSRAKSKETPSIHTHRRSGRGQQGESSSGGPGVRPIIRKGSTRASN
jgi:hypothetical protein